MLLFSLITFLSIGSFKKKYLKTTYIFMIINCAGYVMSEFTSAVGEKELTGHGISTIMVVDVLNCNHHCETDSSCWSVNYESLSSLASKLCTLNDGDDISYCQQLTSTLQCPIIERLILNYSCILQNAP